MPTSVRSMKLSEYFCSILLHRTTRSGASATLTSATNLRTRKEKGRTQPTTVCVGLFLPFLCPHFFILLDILLGGKNGIKTENLPPFLDFRFCPLPTTVHFRPLLMKETVPFCCPWEKKSNFFTVLMSTKTLVKGLKCIVGTPFHNADKWSPIFCKSCLVGELTLVKKIHLILRRIYFH